MTESPYDILGVSPRDSLDTIKSRYKLLAKENHPDKTHGLSAEEKQAREEYFKKVTVAYHTIWTYHDETNKKVPNDGVGGDMEDEMSDFLEQWNVIWNSMSKVTNWREIFHNTLRDVTCMLQRHTLKVPVTLLEIETNQMKKVRLILRGCEEPIYTEVDCGKYMEVKYITHMEANGVHHRVRIEMFVDDEDGIWLDDGGNVHQEVYITWSEYIRGVTMKVGWKKDLSLDVTIPPFFMDETMVLSGKGLGTTKSDLILHVYCQQPTALEWFEEKAKLLEI